MHPAPPDAAYYFELFRCPIEFNSSATSMLISRETADQRLLGANEEMAKLSEHIVVKYLAHAEKQDIVNRVKAAIIDHLGSGRVSETLVAGTLSTTPRNLHRKLTRENTTFKQLLNEVRQDLAQQYISDRSMTLTEITFMLGFSEVSSFSRAFKHWTGKPPSAAQDAFAGECLVRLHGWRPVFN
jgi:AraC-like DNA-binding protein